MSELTAVRESMSELAGEIREVRAVSRRRLRWLMAAVSFDILLTFTVAIGLNAVHDASKTTQATRNALVVKCQTTNLRSADAEKVDKYTLTLNGGTPASLALLKKIEHDFKPADCKDLA